MWREKVGTGGLTLDLDFLSQKDLGQILDLGNEEAERGAHFALFLLLRGGVERV